MIEEYVRKVLVYSVSILKNNTLDSGTQYVSWTTDDNTITLDGDFTADELEAMAWWMKNKRE